MRAAASPSRPHRTRAGRLCFHGDCAEARPDGGYATEAPPADSIDDQHAVVAAGEQRGVPAVKYALAVGLTAAMLAVAAPPAHAGTYDVWSCAGPSGEPLPANGWIASAYGGSTTSTCGTRSGSLAAALPNGSVLPGSYARWTFDAPPDTTISGLTIHRNTGASRGYATEWYRSYFLFRDVPVVAEGYVGDYCVEMSGQCRQPGQINAPLSEAGRYSWTLQAQRIIASAQCDGKSACEAREFAARGIVNIHRAQLRIADAHPPVHRVPPSGSLLDTSKPIQGERSIGFDATDAGGGLFAAEVMADGAKVAEFRLADEGSCRQPFNVPVPCPLKAVGTIALDTMALENGARRVQVAVVDAAGNRTLSEPVVVHVRNDKDPNGTGATRAARLTGRFRGRHRVVRRVSFGKTAVVKGRLVDRAGAPIAGARLQVYSRLDRLGARERAVATVTTRANGRYRWMPPRGPSRFFRIAYRTYGSDATDAASTEVKLGVRARIALRVTPRRVANRGRISFRGRLVGGPGKAGTQVTLEAVGRDVRSRVPVTTLRTDKRGRFHFSYRFLRSFAPFTYRFRARLMRQASYPYASGASRIVTVRIVR